MGSYDLYCYTALVWRSSLHDVVHVMIPLNAMIYDTLEQVGFPFLFLYSRYSEVKYHGSSNDSRTGSKIPEHVN